MIKKYCFNSGKLGKKLLVFGAIHGREVCWTKAIQKIIQEINSWNLTLLQWSVTFVPICNPEAQEKGLSFVDKNLNRVLKKHKKPSCYEEELANELCPLVDECDYLLDIHSLSTSSKSFVCLDFDEPAYEDIALAVGVEHVTCGWWKVFSGTPSWDTMKYAHEQGKVATLVECGLHTDQQAENNAYRVIIHALQFLGMISESQICVKKKLKNVSQKIKVDTILFKTKVWKFVQTWKNFDHVEQWQPVVEYENGEIIKAPYTGYIILPDEHVEIQWERMYFGKLV